MSLKRLSQEETSILKARAASMEEQLLKAIRENGILEKFLNSDVDMAWEALSYGLLVEVALSADQQSYFPRKKQVWPFILTVPLTQALPPTGKLPAVRLPD